MANRYSVTRRPQASRTGARLQIAGRRIAVQAISLQAATEPRLRFDRVVLWLVARLQTALSDFVPQHRTVVVTVTAPIRQAAKTSTILQERIRRLLASRGSQFDTVIHGNQIRVRVLQAGGDRIPKLVGFVHNPEPQPQILFDMTRSLLACMDSRARRPASARWLVIANQDGSAPLRTFSHVCAALRAWSVFKRILVVEGKGVSALPNGAVRLGGSQRSANQVRARGRHRAVQFPLQLEPPAPNRGRRPLQPLR